MKATCIILLLLFSAGLIRSQELLYVTLETIPRDCCNDIKSRIDNEFISDAKFAFEYFNPWSQYAATREKAMKNKKILVRGKIQPAGQGYTISFQVDDLINGTIADIRCSGISMPTHSFTDWINWVRVFKDDLFYYNLNGKTKTYVLVQPIDCADDVPTSHAPLLKVLFKNYSTILNKQSNFKTDFHFIEGDTSLKSILKPIANVNEVSSLMVIMGTEFIAINAAVPVEPQFRNISSLHKTLMDSLWTNYLRAGRY